MRQADTACREGDSVHRLDESLCEAGNSGRNRVVVC